MATFEATSVCRGVIESNSEYKWLERLADIVNGELRIFEPVAGPKNFSNRVRLFARGFDHHELAVWHWTANPNLNDEEKDYIESIQEPTIEVIETVLVPGATSVDDLVSILKHGIDAHVECNRIMFYTSNASDSFNALLCENNQLNSDGVILKLSQTVTSLNAYKIDLNDILVIKENNFYRYTYNYLIKNQSGQKTQTKRITDIVREALLMHISWNTLKPYCTEQHIPKEHWKNFRNFIEESSTFPSLAEEIASRAHCSEAEAEQAVHAFFKRSEDVLDHTTIEDKAILDAIETYPSLMERVERKCGEIWRANNLPEYRESERLNALLAEVKSHQTILDDLKSQIAQKKIALECLDEEADARIEHTLRECASLRASYESDLEESRLQLDSLKSKIAAQSEFLDKLPALMAQKIADAKSQAAQFVADWALREAFMPSSDSHSVVSLKKGEALNSPEIVQNESRFLALLTHNLVEFAGVLKDRAYGLAVAIYSAFLRHSPILLIGPNGLSIADVFSCTLSGCHTDTIDATEPFHHSIYQQIEKSSASVVTIEAAADDSWRRALPKLLAISGKFFVVTQPFAEDLPQNARSLLHYVLPILTEPLVHSMPAPISDGSVFEPSLHTCCAITPDFVSSASLAPALYRHRLAEVLGLVRSFLQVSDDEFLMFALPYAYFTSDHATVFDQMAATCTQETQSIIRASLLFAPGA